MIALAGMTSHRLWTAHEIQIPKPTPTTELTSHTTVDACAMVKLRAKLFKGRMLSQVNA